MTKYLKDQTSKTFEILFKIFSQTGSLNNEIGLVLPSLPDTRLVKNGLGKTLKKLRGSMTVEPFYAFSVRLFRSNEVGLKAKKGLKPSG